MDNAAFHKSQKTQELIEESGCKILFLPPYSPDLNPIEIFWANFKKLVQQKLSTLKNLSEQLMNLLWPVPTNAIINLKYYKRRKAKNIA